MCLDFSVAVRSPMHNFDLSAIALALLLSADLILGTLTANLETKLNGLT
ncbi:hypothetical protein [Microcoleus sp. FACHB-831]|nr:hypothetical protein [Microcoleus sp. FACHB-831]